jgi:two-component system, NtrC family, sensor kinase
MGKLSIATKVNLLTTFIIILLSSMLGYYFIRNEKRAISYELNERAQVMLNTLSINSAHMIVRKDQKGIARLVSGILQQSDVIFCSVNDDSGKVIYQEGTLPQTDVRKFVIPVETNILSKKMGSGTGLAEDKPDKKLIGRIELGISLARLDQKQNDVIRTILLVIASAIVFTSLTSFIIFQFVLIRPISLLVDGTRQIAKGDLNHKVPVLTDDEIGGLASDFNQMVADLRRSRDELQRYSQTLEQRVSDRTQALQEAYDKLSSTEEQLIQSAKLASLGTLAGGIAHEVNNPLTSVLGYAQVLLSSMDNENPDRINATEIEKAAVRCKKIIDNLLRFSRQQKISFELVDVNQIIDETLTLIKNQLKNSRINIVKIVPESMPTIIGNIQQLQQVFVNIIINAFDAMPDGGELKIVARDKVDHVEIDFEDTGTGIPPDLIDVIFDPFLTTKPPGKGTGLGLSVSYGIIEKHNGKITVKSEVEKGSVFTVWLPTPPPPSIQKP